MTTDLIFRGSSGAPACPECLQPASIQHLQLPLYGHYCVARAVNTYWTPGRDMVFLSLSALTLLLETGDGDDVA